MNDLTETVAAPWSPDDANERDDGNDARELDTERSDYLAWSKDSEKDPESDVCEACEAQPTGPDGRAPFCAACRIQTKDPGASRDDPTDTDVARDVIRALKVLVRTPATRAWLEANDPKALAQAEKALTNAQGGAR